MGTFFHIYLYIPNFCCTFAAQRCAVVSVALGKASKTTKIYVYEIYYFEF